MLKNIAIITARGGSKRIPGKNIKDFCGKPIIAYSIEAALKSGLFDEVMVSTDSQEILDIAIKFGAKVPFMRSVKNSDDFSGTDDVLLEVLEEYKKIGKNFDNCCCIYPTAPFVTADILIKASDILSANLCNTVLPLVKYSNPIERNLRINNSGFIEPSNKEAFAKRSQDLEDKFFDPGQFYFFKVDNFLKTKILLNEAKHIEITEMAAQDIDTLVDWQLAEVKYKMLNTKIF